MTVNSKNTTNSSLKDSVPDDKELLESQYKEKDSVRKSKGDKGINRKDRRVVRTETKIHEVFLELLKENSYEDITVGMILEHAEINRSTFYKHYVNKHDLASEIIVRCQESVLLPILGEERFAMGNLGFFKALQNSVNKNRDFLTLVRKLDSAEININKSFHDYFYKRIKTYYESKVYNSTPEERDLGAYISADILLSVIWYYLDKGEEIQPDNIIRVVVNTYGLRSYYTPE